MLDNYERNYRIKVGLAVGTRKKTKIQYFAYFYLKPVPTNLLKLIRT